jgi:dihydroflavonol-4-reductase
MLGIGYYDSKLAAQELVNEYVKRYKINVVSVLPGTMFGPYDQLIGTGIYLLSLYNNKMPVVLKGGLPLAHVMDVAEGHVLAMQKGVAGEQYILSGQQDDNRYLEDMCGIIAEELQQKFPHRKINAPKIIVPAWVAMVAAFFSEYYARFSNQPMLLSRDAVRPGAYPSFYSNAKAEKELGYKPTRTFRQAVEEMIDYYLQHNLLESKGRWIDRR